MWPDYKDIIEKAGEPNWYGEQGVPRYGSFHPDVMGVYDECVAFMLIRCQSCHQEFKVALGFTAVDIHGRHYKAPTADATMSFHYGDPPIHGCTGDTMNVETLEIVEFWQRFHLDGKTVEGFIPKGRIDEYYRWNRVPALEFNYRVQGGVYGMPKPALEPID